MGTWVEKAGYATDPRYAYRLIDIIELYDLHKFDTRDGIKWMKEFPNPHQPYLANDLLYIVVRSGDTFKSLSKEFDISQRKLRKYNDLYKGYVLKPGDIIYLDKNTVVPTKSMLFMWYAAEIQCTPLHRNTEFV